MQLVFISGLNTWETPCLRHTLTKCLQIKFRSGTVFPHMIFLNPIAQRTRMSALVLGCKRVVYIQMKILNDVSVKLFWLVTFFGRGNIPRVYAYNKENWNWGIFQPKTKKKKPMRFRKLIKRLIVATPPFPQRFSHQHQALENANTQCNHYRTNFHACERVQRFDGQCFLLLRSPPLIYTVFHSVYKK